MRREREVKGERESQEGSEERKRELVNKLIS